MGLTKSKGNMYPWVTHTHTHLGGECLHKCSYCYVQALVRRYGTEKYKHELRLIGHEFLVKYGRGHVIFVEHCSDMWAEGVPDEWIRRILAHCGNYTANTYVFQTKNPTRYLNWLDKMPTERLLGCTLETVNSRIIESISSAPPPAVRYCAMLKLAEAGERLFITVEPILKGNMTKLAHWIGLINPEFVNIGADSKGTGLPEPSSRLIREFIGRLQFAGIEIREKRNLERLLNEKSSD